jgi:hypothetical protein
VTERKEGAGGPGEEREPALPADEEAAWAQIVAAYGDEPGDRIGEEPGDRPGDDSGDRPGGEPDGRPDARDRDRAGEEDAEPAQPARSFTVYAAGTGPRDWQGPDDEDDDHFTPPEPPPLPEADATTKFAWIAALGGPLLLIGAVLFDVYLSWWIVTLGVGGFLGGFATLLTRLRDGRDDDLDDPGSGAVV